MLIFLHNRQVQQLKLSDLIAELDSVFYFFTERIFQGCKTVAERMNHLFINLNQLCFGSALNIFKNHFLLIFFNYFLRINYFLFCVAFLCGKIYDE